MNSSRAAQERKRASVVTTHHVATNSSVVVQWYTNSRWSIHPDLFSFSCLFSESMVRGFLSLFSLRWRECADEAHWNSAICPQTLWLTILAAMTAHTLSWTCCKRLSLEITNADNPHYPCSLRFWPKPRARRRTLVHRPSGCCLVRTLTSSWARTLTTFVSRCPTRKAFTMPVWSLEMNMLVRNKGELFALSCASLRLA